MTIDFLEDILFSPNLLPAEHKIAGQLLRLLTMDETKKPTVDLSLLLTPSQVCKLFSFFKLFTKTITIIFLILNHLQHILYTNKSVQKYHFL